MAFNKTRSLSKENSTVSLEELTLFYRSLCLFFEYKHPKFLSCKISVSFHQVPQCPGFFLRLLEAQYPHFLERGPGRIWRQEPECLWFGAAQMVNLSLPPLGQPSLAMARNERDYSETPANREEKCYAISNILQVSDILLPTTGSIHIPTDVRRETLSKVYRTRLALLTKAWVSHQVWVQMSSTSPSKMKF